MKKFLFALVFNLITSIVVFAQEDFNTSVSNYIKTREDHYEKIDTFFKDKILDIPKLEYIIKESKKYNSKEIELYAQIKLGILLRDKSSYEKAIKINDEVLVATNSIKDDNFKIVALNMQGVIYRRMDSIRKAINYHQKALELAEKQKKKSNFILKQLAISSNSIGNVYLTLDEFELAKEKFEKCIGLERATGNDLGLAINYQNIGGIYEKQNQLDKALENYFKSLEHNAKIKSELGKLICFNSIGQIYLKQNNVEKATLYLQDVVSMSIKTEDDFYISNSYLNYGWLLLSQGKIDEARTNLLKSLRIANAKKIQSTVMDTYKILSQLEEKAGNHLIALEYYRQFHKVKENIVSAKNIRYINELSARYNIQKKQAELKLLKQENKLVKERLKNTYLNYFLGLLLSLLVIGVFYIYHRQKQLKSEKELLLMEQKMFRVQLNPHFIFNALNSIKSYIIKNEKDNAVYYLNKFSKLFNVILSGINEKDVSLAEELKIIEVYAMLENIRMNNEIDFKIEVDKEVNSDLIKVPSLILQPFVENAIWHGLNTKKEDKKLTINVAKQDKLVVIKITDNGIGRKKAQEIKSKKTATRESFGIKITQERLESYYKNLYSYQVNDLLKEEVPAGTEIILKLPIVYNNVK